jgi:hypothetical protein
MNTQLSPSRLLTKTLAASVALALTSTPAWAGTTATQTVTYEVTAINEISTSGNPGALIVNSATAGSAPTDATDASTTWAVTTNQTGAKITAAIDTAMPAGTTLKVNLAAPTGASSLGAVTLSTVAVDAVTGITQLNESAKTVEYTLSATAAAGVVASASKTVTFTITGGV